MKKNTAILTSSLMLLSFASLGQSIEANDVMKQKRIDSNPLEYQKNGGVHYLKKTDSPERSQKQIIGADFIIHPHEKNEMEPIRTENYETLESLNNYQFQIEPEYVQLKESWIEHNLLDYKKMTLSSDSEITLTKEERLQKYNSNK